ncbi:MAG: pilin N-terminal domain-containing protein [Tissierellia bacterium]|nr:pilin N-terminal domain-containing protein [Tissierellia bacterium]
MNKRTQRWLSLVLAVMMVFAMAVPGLAVNNTTEVILHKIVMSPEDFGKFDQTTADLTEKYTGNQIENLTGYFGASAVEVDGVSFKIYVELTTAYGTTKTGADMNAEHNTTIFDPALFYEEVPGSFITGEGTRNGTTTVNETGTVSVTLPDGTYIVVEDYLGSSYYNEDGSVITDTKAIPFKITLPMGLLDGTGYFNAEYNGTTNQGKPLHIYPKNTEDKPDVKKTHDETVEALQMKKSAMVGQSLPYLITTTIPANAKYATATWTDQMTEGLTIDTDVPFVVTLTTPGATPAVTTLTAVTDYTLIQGERDFTISLTDIGLEKINNSPVELTVEIRYNAILNDLAVVEVPEANDVFFHYGNSPDHGNTPIPTKPENGKITVTKTFAEGAVAPAGGIEVELVDAQTGIPVTQGIDADGNPVAITARQTLTAPDYTYTWTNLDNTREYKVVEITTGFIVNYGLGATAGTITIENKDSDNPPPINPDEPTVTTYGKKFVKTDDAVDPERLAGAEFVVYRFKADGVTKEYLALKDGTQDLAAYNTAQANYLKAIAEYNAMTTEQRAADANANGTPDGQDKLNEIAGLEALRDAAYIALNTQWQWVAALDDAFVFTSGYEGRFEVTGLDKGTYYLHETKAPAGYALNKTDFEFIVDETSYSASIPGQLPYDLAEPTVLDGQQIKNKKITIPETGGIGTVIFAVVGLTLMGGAVIAFKRREIEE